MAARPDVRWVPPGRSVAVAVGAAIRDLQGDDPLRLVRVVAPDSATVDGLRRALPRCGGSCGAEIGGTLRLATRVAAPELGDRRVAPDVAVLAVVQQVLGDPRLRPAAFAGCADHPATHDAIVRSFHSLDGAFTLPAPAAALAGLAAGRDSASAVCQVVGAVRERLLQQRLVDAAEVLRIATRRLADPTADPDRDVAGAPLVLVVTQQFNPAHVALLQALVARAPGVVVVAATSRDPELSVAPHVARLVGAEDGSTIDEPPAHTEPDVPVAFVSCPDHDEEVREITRRIVGLLEHGVAADRIAVFYPPAGPHRASIAAALGAAGVAARGQVAPALKGSVAGQLLRLLVTVATDGLSRRTLVEIARLAPVGRDVADDGTELTLPRRADAWNRLATRHGVVGERDWAAFEAALPPDDDPGHRRHLALVRFVRLQRHHRDAVRNARTWAQLAAALEQWFTTHCGTVEWRLATWKGVPTWQLEAAEQVESVFATLAEIDQFGLALRTTTAARLITAFLDGDVVTAESKGAGVFVDQIVGATGAIFDHAFVVGANDHLVPGRVADDLVLTRQHGAEPLGVLTGPANRPLRDRRGLFAALDGATTSVTVTCARWDIRAGGDLYPSPLVTGPRVRHEHVASHAARLTDPDADWLDADEWFTRDPSRSTPRLARRRRAITSRAQDAPGEYDGQVGDLGATHPFRRLDGEGRPAQVGITSFEEWVRCGLAYFVTRVLGARTDDLDPSEITDIEPQRKGTLIHRVFERLIQEWITAHPDTTEPWVASAGEVDALALRAEELLDDEAATLLAEHRLGHPEMWRARRHQIVTAVRAGLVRELLDPVTPLAVEFAFGNRSDGVEPPAVFRSSDGEHEVHFSGSIDRLDRLRDGSLRVMDLKSGLATAYKKITPLDPLGPDQDRLQLAFYGWAVQQLRDQPVTGAIYRFVGRPDADDDVALELTPEVHEHLHARLTEIAGGIHHGRFVPGEVGPYGCPACAPDQLGAFEMNQRLVEWSGVLDEEPETSGVES
jgi:hypothetical protein